MSTTPTDVVPASIVKGDSLVLHFDGGDYLPADGWALSFDLSGPASFSLGVSLDAAETGWDVVLSATSSTEDLLPGRYRWTARQENAGLDRRVTIGTGYLDVLAEPADLPEPADVRSFARRALEALEAAILTMGKTTSFSIDGRSYQYASHAELLAARARLRAEVAAEDEAAAIARGEAPGSTAWVRF